MSSIRARATHRDGIIEVRALIDHPVESPDRDEGYQGFFISEVTAEVNGEKVLHAHWGPAVSPNPLLEFEAEGEPGDTVTIRYTNNEGESDSHELEVS